jgi:hypothetical protein
VLADLAVAIADGATTIGEIDILRHQERTVHRSSMSGFRRQR